MNIYTSEVEYLRDKVKQLEEALAKQEQFLGFDVVIDEALLSSTFKFAQPKQEQDEPKQEEYLSKAYRLANDLRCHLAIAPAPQPAQKPWVGLTDREKSNLWLESRAAIPRFHTYATLVEAKLKDKNTII